MSKKNMTYSDVRKNEEINTYIRQADAALSALGYTEHSFAHVTMVAEKAGYILRKEAEQWRVLRRSSRASFA